MRGSNFIDILKLINKAGDKVVKFSYDVDEIYPKPFSQKSHFVSLFLIFSSLFFLLLLVFQL